MKINSLKLYDDKLSQLECYANLIAELENEIIIGSNCTLEIYFEKDEKIKFVHPLFLVYVLNFYELLQRDDKYSSQDIRIILNIENLSTDIQSYIKTYLTQYIDCNIVLVVDIKFRDRDKPPSGFTNKKILLYTTENENNLTLLKKQKYNFLPIIKIANNNFNEAFEDKDYWITNKDTGKAEKISSFGRKIFYKSLQLDAKESVYKKTRNTIWIDIFEIYLELTQNGAYITEKFKDIFSEIVENIQKHTKIDDALANGYISFYINRSQKLYELIVSDDYQKGFLSKYYETICDEILKEKQDSFAWKDYNEILKEFENKEYTKILENIFNLKYVLSAQLERITKHFGMPLLLKIVNQLEKLSKEKFKNDSFVNLEIYLNKDELSFLIKYKNGIATVQQLPNDVVKGTYFHLFFPQNLHLDNPAIITQKPLKLTSKYYKELLEEKEFLEKHLKHFQYYFNFKNKLLDEMNAVIIDYSKTNETSDFLRDLYSFAFLNSVQDILVVNYPIEDKIEYLKLFSETTDLSKICNIAFLNKEYPQVLFLGGGNYQEMCDTNTMLSQTYNYNKRNFLETSQGKDSVNLTSNLFYTNHQNKQMFFPFELFLPNPTNQNELLYALMLDNFLELKENHEDIHLDLHDEFHIKKFYYLKYVFENSQWVKLMSFDLAKKIKNRYTDFENIVFVGIEKYSSSFTAELEYLLNVKLQSYIISDLNSKPILEQFDKFKKQHNDKHFIFIRPSVFESDIDNNIAKNLKNYEKYTSIQLTKDGSDSYNWIASYSKNLNDVLQSASDCSMCFDDNKPLYEIDIDKYNIKDLYHTHDAYKKDNKIFQVSWKDAIYFPHIERNTNHYLYYMRTTQFFKNNKKEIQKYFETGIDFKRDEKVPVILTSAHNTNAEFVALINEIVFENDAIIHSLSLNNKEQGYFSIDNLRNTYENKENYYSFYFVDDAISSGEAFKYIYSVLSSFFKDKFQAVFTLIDRTNEKDLNLFNKYYENEKFYPYIKINIHPIKTGFENCYLCERKKIFEKIAINSSLVTIKHTFQEKAKDLAKKNACEIEYELLEPIVDLKNYLRMSSTEYIYQHIDDFQIEESIDLQFQDYYKLVRNYFSMFYLNGKSLSVEIEKFLIVESKIAFLKSLAFPKIYFFKSLRESIHKYIYNEIRKFTYINKDNISIIPILSYADYIELDKIDTLKGIVNHYKDKNRTNVNYFSFLLSLGSFLGINHILSYEVIRYYYNLTNEIKNPEKYLYKNLLDMYPIAVKQLTTYSKEKSKYFERELAKFYKDIPFEYTRTFSRIFGLFVENTTYLERRTKIFDNVIKENTIDEQIDSFKMILEQLIVTEVKNINIKSICIDINEDIKNPFMVDILNDYKEIEDYTDDMKLYTGASIKKDIDYDTKIEIEIKDEKYNIWCNFYKDFITYVRITNSNDELTPIGVIVIEHIKKENNRHNQLVEHLRISRLVLAYQNLICELISKNNMLSAMRTKYDELIEKKRIEQEKKHIEKEKEFIEEKNKRLEFEKQLMERNINQVESNKTQILEEKNKRLESEKQVVSETLKKLEIQTTLDEERLKHLELEKKIIEEKNNQISNSIHMINHTYRNYNKYSSFLMDIYDLNECSNQNICKDRIDSLIKYSRGIELHSMLGSLNKQKLDKYLTQLESSDKNKKIYTLNSTSEILTICRDFLSVCSKYIKTNPTLAESAVYRLDVDEQNEFDITYHDLCGITDEHLESLFFEFIFNIIKQNREGSNILITIKDNEIYIENSGITVELSKRKSIFKYNETSSSYSFGLGLPSIQNTLSLFNIDIECIEPINDGYNCCFKIYNKEVHNVEK